MENILSFDSGDHLLFVHRFHVEEAMSTPFTIKLWVRSPDPSIDLSAIVGYPARFVFTEDLAGMQSLPIPQVFSGLCVSMVERETPDPTAAMVTVADWIAAGKPPLSVYPPLTLTTYELTIRPTLWKLSQNKRARIFQHVSIPDIVDEILSSYSITPIWQIDRPSYPKLELRTQYFETDLDFVSRLLEEAGIAYHFHHDVDPTKAETDLVLSERPQSADLRLPPLFYREDVSVVPAGGYVTEVRMSNEVRTGKYKYRDFDFRNADKGQVPSQSDSVAEKNDVDAEQNYERYDYRPTQSLAEGAAPEGLGQADIAKEYAQSQVKGVLDEAGKRAGGYALETIQHAFDKDGEGKAPELKLDGLYKPPSEAAAFDKADEILRGRGGTPVADDRGVARFQKSQSGLSATVTMDSIRTGKWQITFKTNAMDLEPGKVLSVVDHPSERLSPKERLMIVERTIEGEVTKFTHVRQRAVFAALPYRPAMKTPKPSVHGIQNAMVKGPQSPPAPAKTGVFASITQQQILPDADDVYVDEFGRVRVQLVWDDEGHPDSSSAWMRVSQGWAGGSYGAIAIPRVGHEVLVAFINGDPDNPIVVGRVYNGVSKVPHTLAENKTVTTLKSSSTPGGGTFNELRIEDAADREMIFVQAGKDLVHYVRHDERRVVGHHRASLVQELDVDVVGKDKTTIVGDTKNEVSLGNEVGIVGGDRIDVVGMSETKIVGAKYSVRVGRGATAAVRQKLSNMTGEDGPLGAFFGGKAESTMGQIPARPLNGLAARMARLAAAPLRLLNAGKDAILDTAKASVPIPDALKGIVMNPVNKKVAKTLEPLVDRINELMNPLSAWGARLSEGPISVLPELVADPLRQAIAAVYAEIPRVDKQKDSPGEIGPPPTELSLAEDHIELTTGQASIVLDGPNISLIAAGTIRIQADKCILIDSRGANVSIAADGDVIVGAKKEAHIAADGSASLVSSGGDVVIKGGPTVQINPTEVA
jgi:type VI secretion system secreted protein VgrG